MIIIYSMITKIRMYNSCVLVKKVSLLRVEIEIGRRLGCARHQQKEAKMEDKAKTRPKILAPAAAPLVYCRASFVFQYWLEL